MYINSDGFYAFYMQEWSRRPGLPFLFPHIHRLRMSEHKKTRSEILSELLKFKSFGQYSSWDEDDASDLEGNAWNEFNVGDGSNLAKYNVDVYQRDVWTKIRSTIFSLAISARHGATQYLIGCLPFSDKSPLEDIEKGSQELAKSTEDKYVTVRGLSRNIFTWSHVVSVN